jgi:hypothetical protein
MKKEGILEFIMDVQCDFPKNFEPSIFMQCFNQQYQLYTHFKKYSSSPKDYKDSIDSFFNLLNEKQLSCEMHKSQEENLFSFTFHDSGNLLQTSIELEKYVRSLEKFLVLLGINIQQLHLQTNTVFSEQLFLLPTHSQQIQKFYFEKYPYGKESKILKEAKQWLQNHFEDAKEQYHSFGNIDYPNYYNMPKKISSQLSTDEVDYLQAQLIELPCPKGHGFLLHWK